MMARQFNIADEVKTAIREVWERVVFNQLLANPMPERQKNMLLIKVSDGSGVSRMWTDSDGGLSLESLKSVFPDATNLVNPAYDGEKVFLSISNEKIFNPDRWDPNIVYLVHNRSRVFSRPSTPMEARPISPYSEAQSNLPIYVPIEVDDLICRLENYLFFEEVGDTKCCFTIISPHHAVSFNHGHHHDWNSSPIENQTIVTICNQEGKKFETKVIECDAEVDFIVVRSEVSLVSKPPIIGIPRKLERYILLGYPNVNSSYQALEGVFSSIERDDEGRMRGSSGSNRGYSGGPIFNYRGELLGINVANESSAKFIGFNGKSTVNEIVSEMNATFPFLSVIVPTYCIAFKYHKDCKFKP